MNACRRVCGLICWLHSICVPASCAPGGKGADRRDLSLTLRRGRGLGQGSLVAFFGQARTGRANRHAAHGTVASGKPATDRRRGAHGRSPLIRRRARSSGRLRRRRPRGPGGPGGERGPTHGCRGALIRRPPGHRGGVRAAARRGPDMRGGLRRRRWTNSGRALRRRFTPVQHYNAHRPDPSPQQRPPEGTARPRSAAVVRPLRRTRLGGPRRALVTRPCTTASGTQVRPGDRGLFVPLYRDTLGG